MLELKYMESEMYWTAESLEDYIAKLIENAETWDIVESDNMRYEEYINIPCAFDTETTSFWYEDESGNKRKAATMYIWMLNVNGFNIVGRTWEQFGATLEALYNAFIDGQDKNLAFVIYVHNLGFDFQFLRKWIPWLKVFSIKPRRPVYADTDGFEFRCSYMLSGLSLEKTGDQLVNYPQFRKKVGDLDYNLIRHSKTPLTEQEMGYCLGDVNTLVAYIQEKIDSDGDISKIPLTNTGYVRRYCRNSCFEMEGGTEEEQQHKRLTYHALMKSLQINNKEEYMQLRRGFMGGFTHCSVLWSRKTITTPTKSTFVGDYQSNEGIGSIDITSSYPYVMVTKYFPMTRFEYIGSPESDTEFYHYIKKYCCLFDVEFHNLRPKMKFENPLSVSKCSIEGKAIVNNGRIVKADTVITTLTELDWITMLHFYNWDDIIVSNLRVSSRGRLPKELIMSILHFYQGKTTLKGVTGKEAEYLLIKGMLNSVFGMAVTNIVRDEHIYDATEEEWYTALADVDSQLTNYNQSFTRFLSYAWGVWVTAHARRRLFEGIEEFGEDYIYADTDSIKCINLSKHKAWIESENKRVLDSLYAASLDVKFNLNLAMPKTAKGEKKIIGVWDIEDGYYTFKSIGAKRYMYEYPVKDKDGTEKVELSFTMSGLNKKVAVPWLLEQCEGNHKKVFWIFDDGLYVKAGHTGKMTSTYIDEEDGGLLVDYLGNEAEWYEQSSLHMEAQSYYLSLSWSYQQYVSGVQEVEL